MATLDPYILKFSWLLRRIKNKHKGGVPLGMVIMTYQYLVSPMTLKLTELILKRKLAHAESRTCLIYLIVM